MPKDHVNIYTIAREAGVSPATVSRVMTRSAKVSSEKRERVEEAIRRYNFTPNALAKGLSTAKTHTIGLLIADISSPFYARVATECERVAEEMGYMLLVLSSLSNSEKEKRQLIKLYEQRVDAVLMVGGHLDNAIGDEEYAQMLNRVNAVTPVISTGKLEGAQNYQVCIDEAGSMRVAMEYLFSLGHERIALIGGRGKARSTLDKQLCYRDMLLGRGLPCRTEYVWESAHYSADEGYECMKELLKQREMPTAVIGINDYTAAGIIRAAHEAGLKIPEDLSLIAFDNTYLSEAVTPKLTSVACDYAKFARLLMETAVNAGAEIAQPAVQVAPVSLIRRDSCRHL